MPIDTGLLNVNVSCGTASASEDGSGNPTASGTGSLANVSISLSLTSVLQSLLGGPLPSAASVCNGVPAASGSAGSNSNPLSPTVQSLLDQRERDSAGQPRHQSDQRRRWQRRQR